MQLASYSEAGFNILATVEGGVATPLPTNNSTSVGNLRTHASGVAFFTGGSPTSPTALYRLDLASKALSVVASSFRGDSSAADAGDESKDAAGTSAGFDPGYFSTPEQVEFDAKVREPTGPALHCCMCTHQCVNAGDASSYRMGTSRMPSSTRPPTRTSWRPKERSRPCL